MPREKTYIGCENADGSRCGCCYGPVAGGQDGISSRCQHPHLVNDIANFRNDSQ